MLSLAMRTAGLRARMAAPALARNMSSAAPQKSDVIFSKTSSPQLDETLTKILHRIVLPYRLPAAQRKLIFSEEHRQRLQTDPIIIEVDGYEHRFDTLNFKNGDMPNSRAMLLQAIRLMKTPADWDNLVRLLSGFERSKRTIKLRDRFRILREAGRSGNIWAIIDALRRSEKSGYYVRYLPVLDELLYWVTDKAVASSWDAKQTRQAATWATIVMDILEQPQHRRQKEVAAQRALHREPQVLAQYLLVLAAREVFHGGKVDADHEVTKVATQLVNEWPAGKTVLELHPVPKNVDRSSWKLRADVDYVEDYYLHYSPSRHIGIVASTLKAIELAKQVVSPELGAKLDGIATGVKKEMDGLLTTRAGEKDKRGWKLYDNLLGPNQLVPKPQEEKPAAAVEGEAEAVEETAEVKA